MYKTTVLVFGMFCMLGAQGSYAEDATDIDTVKEPINQNQQLTN